MTEAGQGYDIYWVLHTVGKIRNAIPGVPEMMGEDFGEPKTPENPNGTWLFPEDLWSFPKLDLTLS